MSEPAPGWSDELRSVVVKVTPSWIVMVTPMIYNDRVVLARRAGNEWRTGYVAGFCYDKGAAAGLAAAAWDPEVDRDPVGFKKRACDSRSPVRGEGEVDG